MSKGSNNYPGGGTGKDKISMKSQQLVQGNNARMERKLREKQAKKKAKAMKTGISIEHDGLSGDYLFRMSLAPEIQEESHWFQMLPALFFTAIVIMITRMASYERAMDQFFWSDGSSKLTDFFSYYKMIAILICAVLALVLLLYRIFTQTLYIKRSHFYIPIAIYTVFVLVSYLASDYKEFALWGWNDRFEGTVTLISYMVMLVFIMNTINTERNVKQLVYTLAGSSALLSLVGLSQALGHDVFRTPLGKKLITPSWFWDQIGNLSFTFQNNEIYQTVYNINYVSFYLTLLIPLFGLLFIRSVLMKEKEPIWKKVMWGLLFTLEIFNLIGSASSGGFLGMAFVVLMAILILNKRIIQWWKPVLILLVLTIIVAGVSYDRWLPELKGAMQSTIGQPSEDSVSQTDENTATAARYKIDYIETVEDTINFSLDGNEIKFVTDFDNPLSVEIYDKTNEFLSLVPTDISPVYRIDDNRFTNVTLYPIKDEAGNDMIVIKTGEQEWPFVLTDQGVKYLNGLNKLVALHKVSAIGWENNSGFGSGRGYIWSRTIPMMKNTLILGHGADTYCIYFPHEDYAGKYNSSSFSESINTIVDKPHNMYMGIVIGTGGISLLALLAIFFGYLIQSVRIYRKKLALDMITFTGVGIFLGIFGFLISALVNDSSVSVTPMFYGLLATGISINMILKREAAAKQPRSLTFWILRSKK